MIPRLRLEKVDEIPHELEFGVIYVSLPLGAAAHLCPCGCGNKILTKVGKAGWKFTEKKGEATFSPSFGNWQLDCRSHYWIRNGKVVKSYDWSDEEIKEGREADLEKRRRFYEKGAKKSAKKGPKK